MELDEALKNLLRAYQKYYDLKTKDVEPPFEAEAEFHSHEEHYFLLKRAVIDDIENNEIIYFATEKEMGLEKFDMLDSTAWERGLKKANPSPHHQSTNVSLVILAQKIDDEALKRIRRTKHSVSYKGMLHGYSNYQLIAMELSSGRIVYNRLGHGIKRILEAAILK